MPGVKTSRDSFVVDIDPDKLKTRIQAYFDSGEIQRAGPDEVGFVWTRVRGCPMQFAFRPYDTRWLYWEANGGLLDRPCPECRLHIFKNSLDTRPAQVGLVQRIPKCTIVMGQLYGGGHVTVN